MGIEWTESLSIGIEKIDNQHKELLAHFDRLLHACKSGKGTEELKVLLGFLDEYVIKHFSEEEVIQQQHLYPGYSIHKVEHDSFVARLNNLKDEINKGGIELHHVIETNHMLLKWLIHHISTVDVQLGKFLKSSATQESRLLHVE